MRKFVSVVAVLAMVFALAMPAFAAAEPEGNSVVVGKDTSVKFDGDFYVEETYMSPTQAASAQKAAMENAGKDAELGDAFWIDYVGSEDETYDEYLANRAKGGTVTIVYNGDKTVAGVLYFSEERAEWDYAPATQNKDGTYSVTLKHFCEAVLVLSPKAASAAPSGSKPASSGAASPQTGFDPAGYMMVTATLVLFAGFCFVKARKVTE